MILKWSWNFITVKTYHYWQFTFVNFSSYLQDQNAGKMFADEAAALFERSITTTMKENMLIFFAYADFEEVMGGVEPVCVSTVNLIRNFWTV